MRFAIFTLGLVLAAADLPAQTPAPADTIALEWGMDLDGLAPDAPPTFVAVCPPGETVEWTIWGTGTYTSDSSICLAAVHAGAFPLAEGGSVVVAAADGLSEYVGSIGNGIASQAYPAWHSSFRFPGLTATSQSGTPGARVVYDHHGDWYTRANTLPRTAGVLIRFACSPGGVGGNVWGTDIYTDDSSICEAAVHAGVIRRAEGGVVHFERLGAQPSFQGSERNGVTTMRYPSWPGSFRFVAVEGDS